MASIPGVFPRRRATEQFRQEAFHSHRAGVTQLQLTRTHGISCSIVERWYQDFLAYRVKELDRRSAPLVLGIDEHFYTKKQGYATTLVDLRNHKVLMWCWAAMKAHYAPIKGRSLGEKKY